MPFSGKKNDFMVAWEESFLAGVKCFTQGSDKCLYFIKGMFFLICWMESNLEWQSKPLNGVRNVETCVEEHTRYTQASHVQYIMYAVDI